jgi:hypothetical protein
MVEVFWELENVKTSNKIVPLYARRDIKKGNYVEGLKKPKNRSGTRFLVLGTTIIFTLSYVSYIAYLLNQ